MSRPPLWGAHAQAALRPQSAAAIGAVVLDLLGKIRGIREAPALTDRLDALPVAPVDLLAVLLAIETRLGIEVRDEVLVQAQTVGDFVALVGETMSEPGGY